MASTGNAEREAEKLLRREWADERGLLALPIDPIYIARQLGIDVYISRLGPDVSAIIVAAKGKVTAIYLSDADSRERQRFSCAHEIGHFIRRRASGVLEFGFIDRRDHLAAAGTDPEERWANRFAAALLMPESLVRGSPQRRPRDLAPVFDVSPGAMRVRLETLGLVDS